VEGRCWGGTAGREGREGRRGYSNYIGPVFNCQNAVPPSGLLSGRFLPEDTPGRQRFASPTFVGGELR